VSRGSQGSAAEGAEHPGYRDPARADKVGADKVAGTDIGYIGRKKACILSIPAATQVSIHSIDDSVGVQFGLDQQPHFGGELSHQQGGGHPLARDIADGDHAVGRALSERWPVPRNRTRVEVIAPTDRAGSYKCQTRSPEGETSSPG
jgi:hypothetical protein